MHFIEISFIYLSDTIKQSKMKYSELIEETKSIISEIKESYDFGSEYFEGEFLGLSFKIRMNKDHARNHRRNDDDLVSNLSLVNCFCNEADTRLRVESNNTIQAQFHEVYDWEKAEELIIDFFFEMAENNDL